MFLLLLTLPLLCNAFSLTNFAKVENSPIIAGSTKPLENFDPFNFAKDDKSLFFYREAELKHGRLGMVAATTIPIVEQITHKPAVHGFDELTNSMQIIIIFLTFISEFASMYRGWKNPYTNPFELKEKYQPGDMGFALSGDLSDDKNIDLLNKELNNGRLAMISSLGMIIQELVTEKTLF
jgi:hypothetical protein